LYVYDDGQNVNRAVSLYYLGQARLDNP